MRREFKEAVKGKVVEAVEIFFDETGGVGDLDIKFEDKTGFHIRLAARMTLETAELRDWREGEGTLVRKLV